MWSLSLGVQVQVQLNADTQEWYVDDQRYLLVQLRATAQVHPISPHEQPSGHEAQI